MSHWALPKIDLALCNRCGTCIEECPESAVEMGPDGPFFARSADCTYCAECEEICPQEAITCTFEIVWGVQTEASGTSSHERQQEAER